MKGLRLEVGKTYRNREGKEVRIVENDNTKDYPCQGSIGKWYAESGQWCNVQSPHDLIEEVPETTRHAFTVPDGAKEVIVEQEGNRIIVEMVPEKEPKPGDVKFKEGDIVFEDGRIMIIKKHPNLYRALINGSPDRLHVNGGYGIPFTSETFRLATAEEAQLLFDALKKSGKRWSPETMQVEEMPERERIMDFLKDYVNNVTWNYEQLCWLIEDYLEHKEGEK